MGMNVVVSRRLAALTGVVVAFGLSTPASAATPALIGTGNGVVGISQTVEVRAPGFANQTVTLTFSLAGQPVTTAQVSVNGAGSGSATWTPSQAGTWTVDGAGEFAGASESQFVVAAVPTITTFYAANQAQVNVPTNLTAVVSSVAGTAAPVGSVIFATSFGSVLGTVPLTQNGPTSGSATYAWTPSSPGVVPIVATFAPAAGISGSVNAQASSGIDQVEVLISQPLVTLKLPSQYVVGRATNVTAVINQATGTDGAPLTGSVALISNVNGTQTGISGSVAMAGGEATAVWTPTSPGNQVVIAQFSASNSFVSGSGQQIISVLPAPGKDPVGIGPAGQAAWAPGSTVSLAANSSLALSVTTGSGAPASLSESGPCIVSGTTLIAATGAGTCTIPATSPGTATAAANSTTVTIQVSPAPARKKSR